MFIMSSSNSVGIIIAPLLRYSSLYTHLKNAKLVGTISWKSSLFLLLPLLHNYQIVFVMIKKSCWSSIAIWIVGFYQKLFQIPILRKKHLLAIFGDEFDDLFYLLFISMNFFIIFMLIKLKTKMNINFYLILSAHIHLYLPVLVISPIILYDNFPRFWHAPTIFSWINVVYCRIKNQTHCNIAYIQLSLLQEMMRRGNHYTKKIKNIKKSLIWSCNSSQLHCLWLQCTYYY